MKYFEGRGQTISQGVRAELGGEQIEIMDSEGVKKLYEVSLDQVRKSEQRKKRNAPPKIDEHFFRAYDCSEPVLHSVIRQKKQPAGGGGLLCGRQKNSSDVVEEENVSVSILQMVRI